MRAFVGAVVQYGVGWCIPALSGMVAPTLTRLNDRIDALLRGEQSDLDAYLLPLGEIHSAPNSRTQVHCKLLALDGRSLPRTKDLAKFIANRIVDFAIPRGELNRAQKRDEDGNT